jgi:outer membrane murein-binding lipoprotein Lpp
MTRACPHFPAHCNQQVEVEEVHAEVEAVGAEVEEVHAEVDAVGTEVDAVGTEVEEAKSKSTVVQKNPPHMYIIFFIGTPWVHQACTGANTQMGGRSSCGGANPKTSKTLKKSTPRQEPAGIARNTAGGEGNPK